jgi:hypothetical protein
MLSVFKPLAFDAPQGNLVFDSDASADLWLQCHYILVNGGNLTVGTQDVPYAGRARITLWGAPGAIELPVSDSS